MCGICGYLSTEILHEDLIRRMNNIQSHRGPDGEGYYSDEAGCLQFGHRRLSIIDIEGGKQPMQDLSGKTSITYNGEIYNYKELKKELEENGYRFITESDTEVILNAYLCWGTDCLCRFRGMFAFALWDKEKKILFAARDHYGIKPLHYYIDRKLFAFSSELKGIMQLPIGRKTDNTALVDYLRLGYIPCPKTIYEGVYKLPPGHFLIASYESNKINLITKEYYRHSYSQDPITNEGLALEILHDKLMTTVKAHMLSDVPLAFFLSGGIDSSLISYYGSKNSTFPINTFTAGFLEKDYDESPIALETASFLKSNHLVKNLEVTNLRNLIDTVVDIYDEPFSDSSALPTYLICQLISKEFKVALSGDGGDEFWGGYRRYGTTLRYQENRQSPAGKFSYLLYNSLYKNWPLSWKKGALKFLTHDPMERYIYGMHQFFSEAQIDCLFEKGSLQNNYKESHLRNIGIANNCPVLLDRIQAVDIATYLHEDNLTKVDRASMANSLEVRVPFVDLEMTRFASSISASLRVKKTGKGQEDYALKYLLRKHTYQILGPELSSYQKKGFSIPLKYWFRMDEMQKMMIEMLSDNHISETFNKHFVLTLLHQHQSGEKNNQSRLWSLLVLFKWYLKNAD